MGSNGITLTKKQREQVSEIAHKILNGAMLSEQEFVIAWQQGVYDLKYSELAEGYEALKASYYESPTKRGYLCNKHRSSYISETEMCGWGIHYDDTDLMYLTTENRGYLAGMFHAYGIVAPES